jgi:hypothetical protein
MNVGSIYEAVATDIELVWETRTNELVSAAVRNDPVSDINKNELVWSFLMNDEVSILEPPPNPLLAADAEIKVSEINEAVKALNTLIEEV